MSKKKPLGDTIPIPFVSKPAPKKKRRKRASPTYSAKTKAEIAARGRKAAAKRRLVMVRLSVKHTINGRNYGPSENEPPLMVKVPVDIAAMLLDGEARVRRSEEILFGKRGVIVGGKGRTGAHTTRQVPYEYFDTALGGAIPMDPDTGR